MPKEIIIIGAGGHSRVIEDIIIQSGDVVYGFLDDDLTKSNVIGKVEDCVKYEDKFFVIGIGDNESRKRICNKYANLKYYTAIHPKAVVSKSAFIGCGTVVMANAVINPHANIGKHCIINTASIVEHDDILADFVHISPNATLCGGVNVGECTHIGAAAVVKNNISITSSCVVGVGAAVVKNIEKNGVYIGVPAKKI